MGASRVTDKTKEREDYVINSRKLLHTYTKKNYIRFHHNVPWPSWFSSSTALGIYCGTQQKILVSFLSSIEQQVKKKKKTQKSSMLGFFRLRLNFDFIRVTQLKSVFPVIFVLPDILTPVKFIQSLIGVSSNFDCSQHC